MERQLPEIKTPAMLAQEAKAKLDQVLKKSNESEPAAGDGKSPLPIGSGYFTPTEAIKTPPNEFPKSDGKQQQMMGSSDLTELVTAFTHRDEKDKPKTKEAKAIHLNKTGKTTFETKPRVAQTALMKPMKSSTGLLSDHRRNPTYNFLHQFHKKKS